MAIADEKGNSAIINTIDNRWTETFARTLTIDMGCSAMIALFSMTGKQVKEACVPGTITFIERIGRTIREAHARHVDPIAAVCDVTSGFVIWRGKVADVARRTQTGFARGEAAIAGTGEYEGRTLSLAFQNEFLIARAGDEPLVTVPDLITILDAETGEPITTESLRYGFRVVVLGIPCDRRWRTEAGSEARRSRLLRLRHRPTCRSRSASVDALTPSPLSRVAREGEPGATAEEPATVPTHEPIPLTAVRAAQERIAGAAVRTPLVRLNLDDAPAEIYLKLENLQPIGSFKLRGASNAIGQLAPDQLTHGVWTASAGNMAQGVAWCARRLGVPCRVVVPDTAPATKRAAVARLGAELIPVPFTEWWEVFRTRRFPGLEGLFVHPFSDPAVMAGNGTIGLEIVEDLPDVEAVVVPWGGGGLCCGIASALRALVPTCRVYAAEVATGAPLAPSLAAGEPVAIDYTPSFVDGISAGSVMPEMLALAQRLIDGSLVVTPEETAAAVRLLAERNRVIAEGAGAVALAATLAGKAGSGKIVCIVSGGNIDSAKLVKILEGITP